MRSASSKNFLRDAACIRVLRRHTIRTPRRTTSIVVTRPQELTKPYTPWKSAKAYMRLSCTTLHASLVMNHRVPSHIFRQPGHRRSAKGQAKVCRIGGASKPSLNKRMRTLSRATRRDLNVIYFSNTSTHLESRAWLLKNFQSHQSGRSAAIHRASTHHVRVQMTKRAQPTDVPKALHLHSLLARHFYPEHSKSHSKMHASRQTVCQPHTLLMICT